MSNPSIIKQRLSEFAYAIGKNKRQFTKDIGVSESFLVSKGGITEEKIINIISIFPQLNANWLLTGKGSMLLPEPENLSENKSNLAKQNEEEGRNSGIDKLIINLVKQTVMEQIPAIIEAVGKAMRESRVDENNNIQKYLDNQKELSAMQMEIFRDIVKVLAKSDPDAKEIDTKLRQLNRKIS